MGRSADGSELDALIDGGIRPLFQPLVDLADGRVVGYEALARGPQGSALATPDAMFAAARAAGRTADLDWACRSAAVAVARDAAFRHPLSLFVNAEPSALDGQGDVERWAAMRDLRCFAEVTERELAARPASLLRAVDQVREQDWGLALDDIGAHPASLALMPALRPDVLKLDMGLLHQQDDSTTMRVVGAVMSQAADTGATVVAEGIETPEQRDMAAAWGVDLGQGHLLGRPAPLPRPLDYPQQCVDLIGRPVGQSVLPSPFALLATGRQLRRVPRAAVEAAARQLQDQALGLDPAPLLLVTIDDDASIPDSAVSRLERAAARLPLVGVLSRRDLPAPVPGAVVVTLNADDPTAHDWSTIVLGPTFAAALVCRSASDRADGQYDSTVVYDRVDVARAAYVALARLEDSGDQQRV